MLSKAIDFKIGGTRGEDDTTQHELDNYNSYGVV